MKKLMSVLVIFLVIQILLSGVLFSLDQDFGAFQSKQKLLEIELDQLDGIDIEAADNLKLSLVKKEGKWLLPDAFNAPVDNDKLQKVSDDLFALNISWPVATTEAAAPRFKVVDDKFERKISFRKGSETLKILYLGSSPGFKKIHARVDQKPEIYSIDFSAFEVTAKSDDWIDKNLLKMNPDEISKISTHKFSLSQKDHQWQFDNLEESKIAQQEKINSWINKVANLRYSSILGTEEKPEYGLSTPLLDYKVSKQSGDDIEFRVAKQQDDYILKSSSQPYYFKIAEYQIQALLDATIEKFSELKPVEIKENTKEEHQEMSQ